MRVSARRPELGELAGWQLAEACRARYAMYIV